MGFFSEMQIEVLEMYFQEGMKEAEIAQSLGITVSMVNEVLAGYDNADIDVDPAQYAEASADADAEFYGTMG